MSDDPATDAQINYLLFLTGCRHRSELLAKYHGKNKVNPTISKAEASAWINKLKKQK